MKKGVLIFVGLAVLSTLAFAISDAYVSGEYHYRMTLNVKTPESIQSGSEVRDVSDQASSMQIIDMPGASTPPKVRGEAVTVDLGERGVLFALINCNSYEEIHKAFPFRRQKPGDGLRYYLSLELGRVADLPEAHGPKLVTFTEISDPKTIQAMGPDGLAAVQAIAPSSGNLILTGHFLGSGLASYNAANDNFDDLRLVA